MLRFKHERYLLVFLIAVSVVLTLSCESNSSDREKFRVSHVIDGDTVVLDDESRTRLRYLGIDAPEIRTIDSPGSPFGEKSAEFNRALVEGKTVEIEYDEEKYDHYGRLLGYVYVNGKFVNKLIVEKGLAHVLVVKPNDKYSDVFEDAQDKASGKKIGIWSDDPEIQVSNRRFLIKPVNAERYIDQRVVVRGKITDIRSNNHVVKLNMEKQLDIVIFRNDLDNFKRLGIDPSSDYTGTPVEATGQIKMYRGRPQIIIDHPISIRKLN